MPNDKYLSQEDVKLRLNKTICLYDGKPVCVFVDDDCPDGTIKIAPLTNYSKITYIDYTEDKFSAKYIQLGYYQHGKDVLFLSRMPDRENQKQGLAFNAIVADPKSTITGAMTYCKAMENCILGHHNKLSEALNMIEDYEYKAVPIHRFVAVGRLDDSKIGLYYRQQLVGIKDEHSNKFSLINNRTSSFIQKILGTLGVLNDDYSE